MSSVPDEGINFKKLCAEFYKARDAEAKYERENEAKFRAVNQKVGTYEEFRDIVQTSHLKPLERDDIYSAKPPNQPWNPVCSTSPPAAEENTNRQPSSGHVNTTVEPTTNTLKEVDSFQTFERAWKSCDSDNAKCELLFNLQLEQLVKVFRVDLPTDVFETFVRNAGNADETRVIRVLRAWQNNRLLKLNVKFLTSAYRTLLSALLDKTDDAMLRTAYS